MKVGILGAGHIAEKMALTLNLMAQRGDDVEPYAVASRSLEKAEAFAAQHHIRKAYAGYEAMLADPEVDLVYVATPHSHHAGHMRLCLEAGKPVLSEKPFTGNARQAREVLALAQEKHLLAAEAIWPRYMPSRQLIRDLLEAGRIGEPSFLTATVGYRALHKERLVKPSLAGGILLDGGIYALTFAAACFGTDIVSTQSTASLTDSGVDESIQILLKYRDGKTACLTATVLATTDRCGWIYGSNGAIRIDNVHDPLRISVYRSPYDAEPEEVISVPPQLTGFEYEVAACRRALAEGRIECPEMPHSEIIRMMEQMDGLRAAWGVRYPFD